MMQVEVMDWNSQAIEATLDGTLFYLVLNWNESARYWVLGIRNSAYRLMISGISLVTNYPLLYQFRYADMPAGDLFVANANLQTGPVDRDAFTSGRNLLVYMTEQEFLERGWLDLWGRTSASAV
jgi:hypothetical protein